MPSFFTETSVPLPRLRDLYNGGGPVERERELERDMSHRKLFPGLLVLLLAIVMGAGRAGLSPRSAAAAVPGFRIGSIADSRFLTGWTLDGSQMPDARSKLLNPANFTGMTVTDTAATITTSLLADFDLFFIGFLDDANVNAFSPGELAAFTTWVNGGGQMIVTCDSASYDAVCASFGYPATTSAQIR